MRNQIQMNNNNNNNNLLLFLLVLVLITLPPILIVSKNIHITDDLDDVIDDEEDDEWRNWGTKKPTTFDDVSDFDNMKMEDIQAKIMNTQTGPVFGFVKLRLGQPRTADMVSEIAMKWTKLSRTGAIETQFMGVDRSTVMFTMEKGQDSLQLKEFVLNQPESYEIKIGDQVFRRPGDPPLEEVIEKLHEENNEAENSSVEVNGGQGREEL